MNNSADPNMSYFTKQDTLEVKYMPNEIIYEGYNISTSEEINDFLNKSNVEAINLSLCIKKNQTNDFLLQSKTAALNNIEFDLPIYDSDFNVINTISVKISSYSKLLEHLRDASTNGNSHTFCFDNYESILVTASSTLCRKVQTVFQNYMLQVETLFESYAKKINSINDLNNLDNSVFFKDVDVSNIDNVKNPIINLIDETKYLGLKINAEDLINKVISESETPIKISDVFSMKNKINYEV